MDRQDRSSDGASQRDGRGTSRPLGEDVLDRGLVFQGWLGIAFWMAVGLLLEGLLGYKSPTYVADTQRRELFRLAHAHGALLNLLLVGAGLCGRYAKLPRAAGLSLRIGAILMPVGFLLAGVWHSEGDPGVAILLVPAGALLVIFGSVSIAIAWRRRAD
ncbi:MAG: hypothetical protein U1A27_13185 [Phycisphaerae bacterium]